jgi:hypothetical protein
MVIVAVVITVVMAILKILYIFSPLLPEQTQAVRVAVETLNHYRMLTFELLENS